MQSTDEDSPHSLTEHVGAACRPNLKSFQLMGEELALVTGKHLEGAGAQYAAAIRNKVPEVLVPDFVREQSWVSTQASRWLTKYNRSLHTRIEGYIRLGRLCRWEYPWPVVAILGIQQVRIGLTRINLASLLGSLAEKLGYDRLAKRSDASMDLLRRTNRGIFADSVPTVLYALRCWELQHRGEAELSSALVEGPLPAAFDSESRHLIASLVSALSTPNGTERFSALANLTADHFSREQTIFSHHLGSFDEGRAGRRPVRMRTVPAPVVTARGRVKFKSYRLPDGFDLLDHEARVRLFGHAFVQSVTGSPEDYAIARNEVLRRFAGESHRDQVLAYPPGGLAGTRSREWISE